jgi:lipid-A-disaccharide synthase
MNISTPDLFLFAGEQSGDLHGSHLMKALKDILPGVSLFGVGGPGMRAQGLETVIPTEDFEVMGFTDVIRSFPKLYRQFCTVRDLILARNPAAAILIDYPGFNLRLAKALRTQGFKGKIIQYVCPSVWAHGKGRIQHMANTLDLLLAILPFEPSHFIGSGLKTAYIGNPLQEYIQNYYYQEDWKLQMGIPAKIPLVALFPGSRPAEVQRNLPDILEAVLRFKKEEDNVCFGLSCTHAETVRLVADRLLGSGLKVNKDLFFVAKTHTYELMRDSRCAVAKSGTVTLELALHACPTVVVYKLTWLNRFIAKYVLKLKLPHYALANILAEQAVFPELIAQSVSPDRIASHLQSLYHDEAEARKLCLAGCAKVQKLLTQTQASQSAARLVRELISC